MQVMPDDGSVDAEFDPTSVEIPLPPPSQTFSSFDALFAFLQGFHRDNGAALVKRRSGNRRMVDGVSTVTQYWLICDRGHSRPSSARGIRQATTAKTDCPVAISAKTSQKLGWLWVYDCRGSHNHPPSLDPSAHAIHRRRTAEQRSLADRLVKNGSVKASDMRSIMQDVAGSPTFFTPKDIYNDRQKLKRAASTLSVGAGGLDPATGHAADDAGARASARASARVSAYIYGAATPIGAVESSSSSIPMTEPRQPTE
ncbi:hypothetical protein GMORB2_6387 [Geosmithia morbida]|uniref:FAR1 domain-containing protein n=1 Tax=Geosmithia morbida TaxID=1094350 RepID=A0A9P4YXR6_9HYPO|nr:uncharacterized protein GMORB2_6387 [Geosmithia morbida]KAF4123686.1 hypothetical protein GMORB2_6387 [Geosmithia morbida]